MSSDERPEVATKRPVEPIDRHKAIEVLRALQVSEARTPAAGYPLANDQRVRAALQLAIDVLRVIQDPPCLENPIKAEFTMLPPPADHRLARRELPLELPEGSYLRGVALDWPDASRAGGPRLVWEWSEPAPREAPHVR